MEDSRTEEEKQLLDEAAKFAKLDALANSEGGKLLIAQSRKHVLASIEMLLLNYANMSELEIRTYCARAKERMDILQILTGAYGNQIACEEELTKILENKE